MPTLLTTDYERSLIAQTRSNPEAFRELYRHYFPRVYAYIAYRVGRVQDAEDLTADTFVRVVEALHTFEHRGAGSFAAWVFQIAHNEVAQHYRMQGRIDADVPLDAAAEMHSSLSTPDAEVLEKERVGRLRQWLAILSPRRREIMMLRFFGELHNHEIAVVVGLDERTVASHISRGLEDLQARYAHERLDI